MLEIEWTVQAVDKLEGLENTEEKEIRDAVDELSEKQFSHPDLKPIKDRNSKWIWRLKVKRKHTDHRIFIDLQDSKLIILDFDHRDTAYEN